MDKDKYIGRLLDNRYEILEVIGTGGMAVVYKARCHRLNRLVAIKILKDDYCQDEEFRRRFQAESQAVAMLSHPNIVSVYDVSNTDGADYIVMELIDGITLKQYMEKKGVLNWKETLHFAIQIGKALEHAHGRGIVHRDIKPHNVMVLKNGSVKVTDFGIARVMSKSNTLTREALGSVHYISPEQAKGGRVDNRSDIYSLGVVMYEMMTGRPPYDGESPVAVAIQHIKGGAPMPSTLNPNIPGGLEQIIMKAMAHNADSRYLSATAMLYDMDEFRKNPTMLFDYNTPPLDEVTKLRTLPQTEEPAKPPQTAAERAVGKSEQRRSEEERRSLERRQNERRRRRQEEEERRSRMVTIAIIACSVVVIIAILVFLGTLFGDGIFGHQEEKVEVPRLLGEIYENLPHYDGLEIEIKEWSYVEGTVKGEIVDQNPAPGEMVFKGNKVTVTVSNGPETPEKTMVDLTGVTAAQAESYLNGLNRKLQILTRQETSETVEEGLVIRTEPKNGDPLAEGQTVTLWVSSGKAVRMEEMPAVTGKNEATAREILKAYGFENVIPEPVESDRPEGEVVEQSVEKGKLTDVNTPIILKISKGPTEPPVTDPPPTDPQPTDPQTTKVVVFYLPDDMTEAYTISIRLDGEEIYTHRYEEEEWSTDRIEIERTGSGVEVYEMYLNGTLLDTVTVNFDEP